jgi:hypothetical protein
VIVSGPELYTWFNERAQVPWNDHMRLIGRRVGNRLTCVVGFTNFHGASVQAHIAADGARPVSRELFWAVGDYAFRELKVSQLLAFQADYVASGPMLEYLGFTLLHRVPPTEKAGVNVWMLTAAQAHQWLEKHDGRRTRSTAAA